MEYVHVETFVLFSHQMLVVKKAEKLSNLFILLGRWRMLWRTYCVTNTWLASPRTIYCCSTIQVHAVMHSR